MELTKTGFRTRLEQVNKRDVAKQLVDVVRQSFYLLKTVALFVMTLVIWVLSITRCRSDREMVMLMIICVLFIKSLITPVY